MNSIMRAPRLKSRKNNSIDSTSLVGTRDRGKGKRGGLERPEKGNKREFNNAPRRRYWIFRLKIHVV